MAKETPLFLMHISLLKQGADILKKITDEQYVYVDKDSYKGGIGKHIRHILDHYDSFLDGWNDKIDYDDRKRNTEIETNLGAAIRKIELLTSRFNRLIKEEKPIDTDVLVKSNAIDVDLESPWSSSTIKRELQFLVSHTVHHFALVAFILRAQQIDVPDKFGIAPSTLHYQKGPKPSTEEPG